MSQFHFSEDNSHFVLHPVKDRRPAKKREIDPTKKPMFFTPRNNTHKGVLTEKASVVRSISQARKKIFHDDRLYFVIEFSAPINSWKSIQSAIDSLGGKITRVYNDTTIKLAIDPNDYEGFVDILEQERSLIVNVRESNSTDKFDQNFLRILQSREKPQDVTIEVSDLTGVSYIAELTTALEEFVKKNEERIELGYLTKNFAIFSGKLSSDTITEIAEQIEVVESVEPLPKIALISYNDPINENVELASVVSLSRETQQREVPTVCAIDSGVNRTHAILQGNISDTYDFTTNSPTPCQDNDGHGSMVSGIAIYGGNTQSNTRVLSKVLMVKGFENKSPVGNIMQIIEKTTAFFSDRTKVFNLSFSAFGPNRALSKMLDDLIYQRNLIVIACAGNIDYDQIRYSIATNNQNYPDYLTQYPIYFPGDGQNVITVGASTKYDSNWIRRNSPSPFTRSGTDHTKLKPDVVFDGGNLNHIHDGNGNHSFNNNNIGVKSASFNDPFQLSEGVGTSFSSPAVATIAANILQSYPFASPYLVKSLILSSTNLLGVNNVAFDSRIQGFGVPDFQSATQSTRWRICYLIQDVFTGSDPNELHRYKFLFPNDADRVTVTFAVGKPPNSSGYLRYNLVKSGNKPSSHVKPNDELGVYPIATTYKAVYNVHRGGNGEWVFEIYPHFDRNIGIDRSIRYGCIVTVESTQNADILAPIGKWIKSEISMVQRAQQAVDKRLAEEAEAALKPQQKT